MPKKGKKYHVEVTVYTPTSEDCWVHEANSLDKVMDHCVECYPNCTSVVMVVVVNKPKRETSR